MLIEDSKLDRESLSHLSSIAGSMLQEIKKTQEIFRNPFSAISHNKSSLQVIPGDKANMVSNCNSDQITMSSGLLKTVLITSMNVVFDDSTFFRFVDQPGFFSFLDLAKQTRDYRLKYFFKLLYNTKYFNYAGFDNFFNKTDQQNEIDFMLQLLDRIDSGIQNLLAFLLSHEMYHLNEGCDIALEYEINADCYAATQLVDLQRYAYGIREQKRPRVINQISSNFLDIIYYVYSDSAIVENQALGLYPPLTKRLILIDSSLKSKGITYGLRISNGFPFF